MVRWLCVHFCSSQQDMPAVTLVNEIHEMDPAGIIPNGTQKGKAPDERLIIIKGYGIQMETMMLSGSQTTKALALGEMENMLINEAILINKVIFYLAIPLKRTNGVVTPFEHLIPRLNELKLIYRTFNEVFEAGMDNTTIPNVEYDTDSVDSVHECETS
ncbi:Phosphatidylinositol N-acetylglucosaminyltransferase subunit H [Babesia sp. Xinjiang]|uniref:Phosphatidylinositol N-acetylglucosaminyltransferase subunit H n=1 Tax=Babesia sp. Xinjiang TaxID=462227 RepID=UPI000A25F061|nr:Phosphatidylinositol N-acetylglucosaminyltransferase subunit H [Babesia sp. Xinjiang]XP_028872110.1 Phosphatidylinositol N-acetylglucosaminyltransferase subunit H [Babesia sp. Xinjiang]ORM41608.1 Phosphatidylinositol N-acetylglucosaminyltransferase subunit H [Babesia sp. Xinjiang]ORM41654.1 Phosphatidylinositol N-acetylglucosaminyltransferase subunit H [Babesia sp. Xinjiang]